MFEGSFHQHRCLLIEMKFISQSVDPVHFAELSLSLLTPLPASERIYEEAENQLPLVQLEWDRQGVIEEIDGAIYLSSTGIKESPVETPFLSITLD